MLWQRCNYEFWWICLGCYSSYVHTETTFCPLRVFLLVIIYFILFILMYVKSLIEFNMWYNINYCFWMIIWKIFFYFIAPNLYVAMILFVKFYFDWAKEAFQTVNRTYNDIFTGIVNLLMWFLYPVSYFYIWYRIWHSKEHFFFVTTIKYELQGALIILIFICTGLILFYLGKFLLFITKLLNSVLISILFKVIGWIKFGTRIWIYLNIKFRILRLMIYRTRIENNRYNAVKMIKNTISKKMR